MFKNGNSEDKKALMYLLIIAVMVLIFLGWLFFLKKSISYEKSKTKEIEEFDKIGEELQNTLGNIKEGFDEFKKIKEDLEKESKEEISSMPQGETLEDEEKINDFKNNFVERIEEEE